MVRMCKSTDEVTECTDKQYGMSKNFRYENPYSVTGRVPMLFIHRNDLRLECTDRFFGTSKAVYVERLNSVKRYQGIHNLVLRSVRVVAQYQ